MPIRLGQFFGRDYSGETFGNLTVIRDGRRVRYGKNVARYVWCRCALCGGEKEIALVTLKAHRTKSCGCVQVKPRGVPPPPPTPDTVWYPLAGNGFTLVDAAVAAELRGAKLVHGGHGYSYVNVDGFRGPLHRWIMGTSSSGDVDHINGDRLDNRRVNLRHATHIQNTWNQRLRNNNKTGIKGVHRASRNPNRFVAQITMRGHCMHLGTFSNSVDARAAYNAAALKYHGEFARLNRTP